MRPKLLYDPDIWMRVLYPNVNAAGMWPSVKDYEDFMRVIKRGTDNKLIDQYKAELAKKRVLS